MTRLGVLVAVLAWGCGPAPSAGGPAVSPPTDAPTGPEAADPVPAAGAPLQVDGHVVHAAKAGRWYPADPAACRAAVTALLAAAAPVATPPGRPLALIVPHGGWRFAGAVAAAGFRAVADVAPDTVVLVGLCHHSGRVGFRGCTLLPDGAMETPLGAAAVDGVVAAEIAHAVGGAAFRPEAFTGEHSLEVLLPFVQVTWPTARIVPVLLNAAAYDDTFRFACALEAACTTLDRRVFLVASSDAAHGVEGTPVTRVDAATAAVWGTLDPRMAHWDWRRAHPDAPGLVTTMCGADAVVPTLWAVRRQGATHCTVVATGNSAATASHRPGMKVVGYVAAVLSAHEPSLELQQQLVDHARAAALAALGHGSAPEPDAVPDARTLAPGGAFVTLKRDGRLHGCIGRMTDRLPLGDLIAECAAAAAHDPRAPAGGLDADAARALSVEISLLGPLEPIGDGADVVLGVHGVKVVAGTDAGARSATFLPQVAPEQDWDHAQLFAHLAAKAGLGTIDWHDPATRVYRFTAFVFSG